MIFLLLQNIPNKLGTSGWNNMPIKMAKGQYMCPFCYRTMTIFQNMASHILTHTGEKPYICQHCNQRFNRKDSRDRHVKKLHSA